jgi:hypothetical protein
VARCSLRELGVLDAGRLFDHDPLFLAHRGSPIQAGVNR